MKTHGEWGYNSTILSPSTKGGWVSPRANLDIEGEKNLFLQPEIEPQFLCRPTSSLVTVLTELSQVGTKVLAHILMTQSVELRGHGDLAVRH
jgi:hypothetical protein